YLHTYAYNMTSDGHLYNVIKNGLVDVYKGVDVYVTDSDAYKTQLMEINGFAEDKIEVLYSPIAPVKNVKKDYKVKKRILWASRVCEDKLAETMVEVGRLLGPEGVAMDVYGALDRE